MWAPLRNCSQRLAKFRTRRESNQARAPETSGCLSTTGGISLALARDEVIPMSRDVSPRVFRSILCPVDFSANSRAALRYAAMLARLSDAHLVVLYVDDPLLAAVMAARTTTPTMIAATETELQCFVAAALRGATSAPAFTVMTRAGAPAREIVKLAEREG